jgi:serine phosphatase RsbU (regulator of sigma subunit)/anti-sigma regulatory factor (Ser/Thr protein kinase)
MVQEREQPQLTCARFTECEFAADLELIAGVLEKLGLDCLEHRLTEDVWRQVELAVAEGLNNAVEHGSTGTAEDRVRLRWGWMDDVLEIRILDTGAFVPTNLASPDLPDDPFSEGGRGGFLMASLMDEVGHSLLEGRHCLTMRKRVGAQTPARDAAAQPALLEAMTEDLSNSYETLATFYQFSEALATAPSFDHFMRSALTRLVKWAQAEEAQVSLEANGSLTVSYYQGPEEPVVSHADERVTLTALTPRGDTLEMRLMKPDARPTVEECVKLARTDPLWRESGLACACPVLFQGTPIGVVSIIRRRSEQHFSAAQIQLVRAVADFLGIARTTAMLQEQRQSQQRALRELEIAAEIQQLLLPRFFPSSAKSRIFGISQAATEVGGDYFDVLPIADRGVLLAIADVMGKGMPAALLATVLRTAIRARLELADDPGRLLSEINNQLSADLAKLDMFITAQLAFFCHETGQLVYASAGHCPILHYARGSSAAELKEAGGIPLGVLTDVTYESTRVEVRAGDRFVFQTDGLYEVHSPEGEILGIERVAEKIPALWSGSPSAFCRSLLDFVRAYSGGVPAADDRTLLTLECL